MNLVHWNVTLFSFQFVKLYPITNQKYSIFCHVKIKSDSMNNNPNSIFCFVFRKSFTWFIFIMYYFTWQAKSMIFSFFRVFDLNNWGCLVLILCMSRNFRGSICNHIKQTWDPFERECVCVLVLLRITMRTTTEREKKLLLILYARLNLSKMSYLTYTNINTPYSQYTNPIIVTWHRQNHAYVFERLKNK